MCVFELKAPEINAEDAEAENPETPRTLRSGLPASIEQGRVVTEILCEWLRRSNMKSLPSIQQRELSGSMPKRFGPQRPI